MRNIYWERHFTKNNNKKRDARLYFLLTDKLTINIILKQRFKTDLGRG